VPKRGTTLSNGYRQAIQMLIQTQASARTQWSLHAVKVQHRIGMVEAGHISVVVVVAAHHRAIAYAASQFLIDQIKTEAPIWKKEQYDDGTSAWIVCARDVLEATDPAGVLHAHV